METANDIITAALQKIGVETTTAAQIASALISLNNMVSLLGADGLMYSVTSESFSVDAADKEYTIGDGGQWDTVRPLKVLSCYLRNSESYDWPVKCVSSKDYNRLSNKSFTAKPSQLYYLPEYPLAKIIFDASPDTAYDAYFEFLKSFTEFATAATTVVLPNEYKEALVYNLAVSLGEDWSRNIPNTVIVKAEQYKEIIKSLNASNRLVPRAKFDFAGIGGTSESGYNIATDDLLDFGTF